ncbi:hypothetical protein RND81_12G125100 [Saponaria officinalis]|uniref:Uncharacterized protein n=1 Tax=Saponaria officinalis TaxID=3572 RepID=A0AAW1H9R6_SAPOF
MKYIFFHLHDYTSKGLQRDCFLYFIPRRSVACEQLLKEEKVHDLLTIGEYPLYMIPLDEDVMSFELDFAYKECLVDADTTSLWHIAKAIHKLESSFVVIPNVRAKGKASICVSELLDKMQLEDPINSSDVVPEISTLILLDREVDMVTPMCCQLTYEGLLDELLHVNSGAVVLDGSIMGVQPEGKKVKVPLYSRYQGSLPDLFREGHSVVVEGFVKPLTDEIKTSGVSAKSKEVTTKARSGDCYFSATEVSAKLDEKYMPQGVAAAIEKNKKKLDEDAEAAAEAKKTAVARVCEYEANWPKFCSFHQLYHLCFV